MSRATVGSTAAPAAVRLEPAQKEDSYGQSTGREERDKEEARKDLEGKAPRKGRQEGHQVRLQVPFTGPMKGILEQGCLFCIRQNLTRQNLGAPACRRSPPCGLPSGRCRVRFGAWPNCGRGMPAPAARRLTAVAPTTISPAPAPAAPPSGTAGANDEEFNDSSCNDVSPLTNFWLR